MARELAVEFGEHEVMPSARRNSVPAKARAEFFAGVAPSTRPDLEERNHMPVPVPDISRNLFDLNGYCSIVTGAGQGIGLSYRQACWRHRPTLQRRFGLRSCPVPQASSA